MKLRPWLGSIAFFVACSSSPSLDTVTLTTDKNIVAIGEKAALSFSAKSSSNGKVPANSMITLTTTFGYIDEVDTLSKEYAVTGTGGEFTATLFCTADGNAVVKASTGTAQRTVNIQCGAGAATSGSTTGSTAGSTTATTGATGPSGPSGAVNDSAITLVAQNKLIPTSLNPVVSTTVLTASLVGPSGQPVTVDTDVVFTTTIGTFQSSNTSTATLKATAGSVTATLVAPESTTGNAEITATFVDGFGETQSATVKVRIVSAGAKNIILEPSATQLTGVGTKSTITGTLYNGGAPLQSTGFIKVSLSGPQSVGSLVKGTGGGTLSGDAREITGIDSSASSGQFSFDFVAGVVGGAATLTVTYQPVAPLDFAQELLTLNVIGPPGLSGAQYADAIPVDLRIRARGSITPNVATVRFLFTDATGKPIADGQPVSFTLPDSASNDVYLTPPSDNTKDGYATVFLNAGAQAETVTVTATASRNGVTVTATSPGIAIVGGVPEYSHLSWSCTTKSHIVAGLALDGLLSDCTFQVADRFSDRVDVGTQVHFRSEAGNINSSAVVASEGEDDVVGTAAAVLRSGDPRPRLFVMDRDVAGNTTHIGEVPGLGTYGAPFRRVTPPFDDTIAPLLPRISPDTTAPAGSFMTGHRYSQTNLHKRGSVRIIGIVQGEESFSDSNGNKLYDLGESFIDLGEPFLDKNDNGIFDDCLIDGKPFGYALSAFPVTIHTGQTLTSEDFYACAEDFVDLNGNHQWDPPNGVWDNYTALWKTTTVTWIGTPVVDMYPLLTNNQSSFTVDESTTFFNPATGAMYATRAPLNVTNYGSGATELQSPTNFKYAGSVPLHSYWVTGADQNLNCDDAALADQTSLAIALSQNAAVTAFAYRAGCDFILQAQDTVQTPRDGGTPVVAGFFSSTIIPSVKVPFLGDAELADSWTVQVCTTNPAPPSSTEFCGPTL